MTASLSISRRSSIFPPAAFTWTPACSYSPLKTGARLLVMVGTIWLLRTASSTELAATSSALSLGLILLMHDLWRSVLLLTFYTSLICPTTVLGCVKVESSHGIEMTDDN